MKVIEISWEESADAEGDDSPSSATELSCPICHEMWLRISEATGRFNENICEHLMFRWYQEGAPKGVNINQEHLDLAIHGALGKVDRGSVVKALPEDFNDLLIWRLNENFWAGFECPGIDTLAVSTPQGASLARHVFGVGGIKPGEKTLRRSIRVAPP